MLAASVGIFFALAAQLDLSEKIARFAHGYELWQLDELPLTMLLLSAALCWFSVRRAREAHFELQERIAAQARVAELLAHNRDLSQRLILAQENERRALARELHDELGQNCTAIRAEASYIMHAAASADAGSPINAGISASAGRIGLAAETLYAMVRDMLRRLRPANLDSLGLEAALQELCERWEEQSGVACGFFPHNIPADLNDASSVTVLRLVQEALTNITRHARASQVRITLQPSLTGTALILNIDDDGCGMANLDAPRRGFGLTGMRERVAALHGEIRFLSEPGKGLHITAELPGQGGKA